MHFLNTFFPNDTEFLPIFTLVKELQLRTALFPMEVTLSGNIKSLKPELYKAYLSMVVKLEGNSIVDKFVHPDSAYCPIVVTPVKYLTH